MLSGNFKEAALGNMNGGSITVNGKGVATSSDYIQTSIGMTQPPFYTQANTAAGMGKGLLKANLTTSHQ